MALGWEISVLVIHDKSGITYKVTRRYSELSISETRIFRTKDQVISKVVDWLE
jgi:hypothetical protein